MKNYYNTWKIQDGYLVYSCGCKFKIRKERPDNYPLIHIGDPYKDWNFDCEAMKMLLAEGNTLGVFQLESKLGQTWCKELKPENIEHMAALGAILRPGALESKDEKGISATKKYCMYKNGEEIAIPDFDVLGPILENTYYQMIYQEDIMHIAKEIAGFDGPQANRLMKGVGKKVQEIIAGLKVEFIDGCIKVGKVNKEQAEKIFENIAKSGRYLFNASHSVCYGLLGQVTAFAKTHFPEYFYTAYLEGAENKQDPLEERYKLIQDAKFFDIKITKPDLVHSKPWFYSPRLKSILFGLNSVKSVGDATIKTVKDYCSKESTQWLDVLVNCLYQINVKAAQNIIKAGIIENGMTRKRQLHELNILCELTAKGQINWIFENAGKYETLKDLLIGMNKPKKEGGGLHSLKDVPKINGLIFTLDNPGYSLEDNVEWIASCEEEILGIALSASLLDSVSTNMANTTCKDVICGKSNNNMLIKCQIDKAEEKLIKNGKNKGKKFFRLDISDETGILSGCMVWAETYDKYGHLTKERNTIVAKLYRNGRGDVVITDVFQI